MGKDEAIIFRIVIPNKGRPAAPVLRDHIAGIDLGQVFYGNFSKRAQLRDGCKDVIAGKGRLQAIFRGNAEMVPPVVKKRIFFHFDVGQVPRLFRSGRNAPFTSLSKINRFQ